MNWSWEKNFKIKSLQMKTTLTKSTKQPLLYFATIGFIVLATLFSCNNDDDITTTPEAKCPTAKLEVKQDTNNKNKVIIEATASITEGVTYKWKVTDKDGEQVVNDNTTRELSWDVKEGETTFCVTATLPNCNEAKEECTTFKLENTNENAVCNDMLSTLLGENGMVYHNLIIKDNYLYFNRSRAGFVPQSGVYFYRIDLTKENAQPEKIIDVDFQTVQGFPWRSVLIGDILYLSVYTLPNFIKLYKTNITETTPSLTEVLDGQIINKLAGKDNYLYAGTLKYVDRFKIFKIDNTVANPVMKEFFSVKSGVPLDFVFNDNNLFLMTYDENEGAYNISKIDTNKADLKEEIVISNIKEERSGTNKLVFNGNELYMLVDNKIRKFNSTTPNPVLKEVGQNYNFNSENLIFKNDWVYMIGSKNNSFQEEIVKIPACSL